jgi:ADP-ribose pyrophosphatase YjhB (NUDIX family)
MEQNKKVVKAGFGVMLMKNNKVLLGHRHIDPEKADSALNGASTWTMPGGKLDFGETFEEGAKREIMEETGIILNNVKVFCVNNERMEQAHFVTVGIFSDDFEGEPQVMEPDEITEWKWFDLDNLPTPLYFPSVEIIDNYKKKEFYIEEHNAINSHIIL